MRGLGQGRLHSASIFLVAVLVGCVGRGEVVTVDVHAVVPPGAAPGEHDVSFAVGKFEDSRPERCRLGIRSHFWGGQSYLKMQDIKTADTVPNAFVDYLRGRGWTAERLNAPADDTPVKGHDVTVSGRVLDFAVDVDGRFLHTDIRAKTRLAVEAINAADGSRLLLTLRATGHHRVLWYDRRDAERLINDVLTETLEKFLLETTVHERTLQRN